MEEGISRNSAVSKKAGRGKEEAVMKGAIVGKGATKTKLEAATTKTGRFVVQKIPSPTGSAGLRSLSRMPGERIRESKQSKRR